MTNPEGDHLDRIEALLERSIIASDERMTRLEQSSERNAHLLERVLRVQERVLDTQERTLENQKRQDQQIQILLNAATRHEATISRLDAILERMLYREGRSGDDEPSPENS